MLHLSYDIAVRFISAIRLAFLPTLLAVWKSPGLLFNPTALSRVIFTNVWVGFAQPSDEEGRQVKEKLITPHAHGVVLDVGAGFGHTMKYLDKTKVTKYVALEPNANMYDHIRLAASKEGFSEADGTLLILPYGIENTSSILSALHGDQVDTITTMLVLCSVPSPQITITNLVLDTLKSGGPFLFYEHVLSPRKDVAWWQQFWAPIWSVLLDGCRIDRPSHLYVDQVHGLDGEGVWKESEVGGIEGESEAALHLFEHRWGRYIKA